MRNINLQKVLSCILLHHPISKAKISSILGINKVTVSQCVDFFLEKGIVHEIGTIGTSRGRPPTLIDINREAGVLVAVDTQLYESKIVVTDLTGQKLEHEPMPMLGEDPLMFLEYIANKISSIKHKYKNYPLGVIGVGIALPGRYNYQTGVIEYIANLKSWNGFPIRSELLKLDLGTSIFTMNIANAGALGELRLIKDNHSKHFVYVNSNWGLSVGVCTDGDIYLGNAGFAGRLGHSIIHFNGKKCVCGKRGCWEAYASVRALFENLYPDQNFHPSYLTEIIDSISKNDTKTIHAVHNLAHYLSLGMINVINAYNPTDICIGGYLGSLGPSLINQIKLNIEEYLPAHVYKDLNIFGSRLGNFSVAYGAIWTVRNNLLDILLDDKK